MKPSINLFINAIFLLSGTAFASTSETPLSFNEALNRILDRSTALKTQEANIGFAQANAIPARFQFVPGLTFDSFSNLNQTNSPTSTTNYGVEAQSNLNLIHWGSDLANLSAARSDINSQNSLYESSRFLVEEAAVNALIAEIQNKKVIEVDRGILEIQTKLLLVAQERFKKGYLAAQEVDKISVDLDNATASLSDAQLQEATSRASLENLLGTSNISTEWPWETHLKEERHPILQQEFSLDALPDYNAAQSRVQAEQQRVIKTQRLLLPSVDANFTYGFYNGNNLISGNSYSAWSNGWTAGLYASWPIFDHLSTYAKQKAQQYTSAIAEVALVQKGRDLTSSFVSAHDGFEIALRAALARAKTLETSRRLYQDSLRRFQAGRMNANDLVIDQRRLLDSELFAVQGWANAHLQLPKLCHSLGKRLEKCW